MTITPSNNTKPDPGQAEILSFKLTGRIIDPLRIEIEFLMMEKALRSALTPEIAARICNKSGTHLIKLVSPRADGAHTVLRMKPVHEKSRASFLPSVNAPDIPFAKIIFRPLEIAGQPARSVVDHVFSPDDTSESVMRAFSAVFGKDVLGVLKSMLLDPLPDISKLSDGEFPIIFIPSPRGGDLQVTPVSPAAAYMEMKEVVGLYFQKQNNDAPRVPRGSWHKQVVSAKIQNISGAIGGPRVRFLAGMPSGLSQYDAEIYRYVRGGRFPSWRSPEVGPLVLQYADLLDRDQTFNNQSTRGGLDAIADRLIGEAQDFIDETLSDALLVATSEGISSDELKDPPNVAKILIRREWGGNFDRARRILSGSHFEYREKQNG